MKEPKIDPKLVIKREPEMRKEGASGGEVLIFIPIAILIYTLIQIL